MRTAHRTVIQRLANFQCTYGAANQFGLLTYKLHGVLICNIIKSSHSLIVGEILTLG